MRLHSASKYDLGLPLLQLSNGFSFVENRRKAVVGEDIRSNLPEDPATAKVPNNRAYINRQLGSIDIEVVSHVRTEPDWIRIALLRNFTDVQALRIKN